VVEVSALGVVYDGADDLRRDRPLFLVRLVVLENLLSGVELDVLSGEPGGGERRFRLFPLVFVGEEPTR